MDQLYSRQIADPNAGLSRHEKTLNPALNTANSQDYKHCKTSAGQEQGIGIARILEWVRRHIAMREDAKGLLREDSDNIYTHG